MAITGTDAARVRSSEPAHSTLAAGPSDTTDEGTRQTGDAQASDAKAAAPKSTLKHAVEPGETLSEIAQRYQTKVATLAAANPEIDNVDRIELGQAVSVPLGPGYGTQPTEATVEPGQTLSELARSYQTSVSQIHSASLRQPPRAAQCRPRGCRPDAVGPGQHERGAASRLGAGDGRRSGRRRVAGLRGEGRIGQPRPATGHLTRYAVGLCVR